MHLADQAELIRLRKEIEQLRMEREIIKKASCLLCQGNWIKYGVIREQQKTYPVTVLCRVMEVSSSAFYSWLKTPEDTEKSQRKASLEAKARQLFNDPKQTYGYRRLSNELSKVGIKTRRYQVRHLMA